MTAAPLPARVDSPRLSHGLRPLARDHDVLLSDVWGVVHNGAERFSPACDALVRFRAGGGTVVLITNAPRPRGPIIEQLDGFGVPREAYDAVVTSGDVTLDLIAEWNGAPAHHIGPPRDLALFDMLEKRPQLVDVEAATHVVCTGLYHDADSPDDYRDVFSRMLGEKLPMICANPDLVVHVGDALLYCAGALAERYQTLGGTAVYAGKPHPPIYARALASAERARGRPIDAARVLCVGDAMRTDIAGAQAAGYASLFLTSGIHRDDFSATDTLTDLAVAQFLDGFRERPDHVADALRW